MRTKHLAAILVSLVLTLSANSAYSGGVVSVCGEAALLTALAGGGTVTFACSGTITLTNTISVALDTTVDGSGQSVTLSGNDAVRVFRVNAGTTLNLNRLTIANGRDNSGSGGGIFNSGTVIINNSTFSRNWAYLSGGGIINFPGASAVISDSTFNNNTTDIQNGGGIGCWPGTSLTVANTTFRNNTSGQYGGGIHVDGMANLTDVTIIDNRAVAAGGGIAAANSAANVTLNRANISGNEANGSGGGIGIWSSGATLSINQVTIDNNTAGQYGGGISAGDDTIVTIANSTVSNNAAVADGGGIFNTGAASLTNVTISGNQSDLGIANDSGGGIYNGPAGILTMTNVTVANNVANNSQGDGMFNAGTVNLLNTLFAKNGDENCVGTGVLDANYSLSSDSTCSFIGFHNLTNANPQIAGLANNGGPTQTHALLPGSPAIDKADPTSFPPIDQRGVTRPQGAGPDIGAYEFVPVAPIQAPILSKWGIVILVILLGARSFQHLARTSKT